jgi:hypothetical protein
VAHLGFFSLVELHFFIGGLTIIVAGVAVGIIAVLLDLPPHAGCAVSGRREGA